MYSVSRSFFTLASNGCGMKCKGFRGYFPFNLEEPCQRAMRSANHLSPNILYTVCVPCMSSAHTCCKLWEKFKYANLFPKSKQQVCIFLEVENPLLTGGRARRVSKWQGGLGDPCTQGRQTVKSGTDEQKRYIFETRL